MTFYAGSRIAAPAWHVVEVWAATESCLRIHVVAQVYVCRRCLTSGFATGERPQYRNWYVRLMPKNRRSVSVTVSFAERLVMLVGRKDTGGGRRSCRGCSRGYHLVNWQREKP